MSDRLRLLDAFAGIGGFSLAAHTLGTFTTTQFIEQNPYCQSILAKHWPDVPIHDDIRTFTASPGTFDVITAGFPCQDLSTAGKQLGFAGNRSVLFYEVIRLLRDIRPKFLVLENVANLVTHADGQTFQEVLFSLAKAGYDAEWAVIPASDVGACHKRARWWLVAYAQIQHSYDGQSTHATEQAGTATQPRNGDGAYAADTDNPRLEGRQPVQLSEHPIQCAPWPRNPPSHQLSPDWRSFVSEPVLRYGDDGLSARVAKLKALGNAVVPQVARIPLARVKQLWEERL